MKEKIDADSNVRKNQFNNLEREFAIHERYIGEKVAKVHDEHYLLQNRVHKLEKRVFEEE